MKKLINMRTFFILLFIVPLIAWKYIDNLQVKFVIALFISVMTGVFLYITINGAIADENEKKEYRWLQILLIAFLIYLFIAFGLRMYDVIKNS